MYFPSGAFAGRPDLIFGDGFFFLCSVFQDPSPGCSFDGSSGLSGLLSAVEPAVLNHSGAEFDGR